MVKSGGMKDAVVSPSYKEVRIRPQVDRKYLLSGISIRSRQRGSLTISQFTVASCRRTSRASCAGGILWVGFVVVCVCGSACLLCASLVGSATTNDKPIRRPDGKPTNGGGTLCQPRRMAPMARPRQCTATASRCILFDWPLGGEPESGLGSHRTLCAVPVGGGGAKRKQKGRRDPCLSLSSRFFALGRPVCLSTFLISDRVFTPPFFWLFGGCTPTNFAETKRRGASAWT